MTTPPPLPGGGYAFARLSSVENGQPGSLRSGDLFGSLVVGNRAHVVFGGGIEGESTGTVTAIMRDQDGFRFTPDVDFWDKLSRRWHRRGESIIAHARELVAILPNHTIGPTEK